MESLNGQLAGGPTAVASAGDRLDVFGVESATGRILHWWRDGGNWTGPQSLPMANVIVPGAVSVGAVSWGPDRLDVFAAAKPGDSLYQWYWDGTTWSGPSKWQSGPKGLPAESLAALSRGLNRLDVFAVEASSGQLLHWEYNAGAWQIAVPHRGRMNAQGLGAVSWGSERFDVFGVEVGTGFGASGPGQLLHWWCDGGRWGENEHRGGSMNAQAVSAVSWGPNRLDVFGVEAGSGQLLHWAWNGVAWLDAEHRGGTMDTQGLSAVSSGPNRLDVFGVERGTRQLLRWTWDGTRWTDAQPLEANLPSGDVSASCRIANHVDVFARGADNSLQHWPGGIGGVSPGLWKNWAGNQSASVEGICRPTCLEELVAIVKTAARHDKRVRAVGSSWSFSDIAKTSGFLVETKKLNRVLTHVLPAALVPNATSVAPIPGSTPAPEHFVHVEAGIVLEDLMTLLDATNRAPATMGGAAGQTLAGVISTSVHGSHFLLPPFPDWVRAIHLVGPDGTQYWIEPKDRPITKQAELQQALGPDVVIKRDDDWFDSTLVTVGALGIVYSVVLEVRQAYKLRETRTALKWSQLRPRLANGTVFTDNAPDAVQVAIDPGSMGQTDPDCFLSARDKISMAFPSTPQDTSFDPQAAFCEGPVLEILYRVGSPVVFGTLLGILGTIPVINVALAAAMPVLLPIILTDAAVPILYTVLKTGGPGAVGDFLAMVIDKNPGLTAGLISEITKSAQRPGIGIDLAHQVMARHNKGECIARGLALEVAFDTANGAHLRFVDDAITLLQAEAAAGRFLGGWFSLRFVGKSRAILSPQQAQKTCMIEYVGLRGLSSTKPVLTKLESLARTHGGIQHWGMFDDLTAADVMRGYPRLNTWRKVRSELTNGNTVHTFDNAFMDRCGLTAPPDTREFDVQFYLAAYADLKAAFGTNYRAALDHWVNQGLPNEGRRGAREFDVKFYLAAYPDLQAAFGTNYRAALGHWVNQGLPNEGRRGAREFDVQFYLATYPDLQAAFGTNFQAALDHWMNQGLPNEGRRGAPEFDVKFYLATYADLRAAFGTNYRAALDHWVVAGISEGRIGIPLPTREVRIPVGPLGPLGPRGPR